MVAFRGGMGTKAEVEVAKENKCIIVPGITCDNDYKSELIIELLKDKYVMEYLKKNVHEYYELLEKQDVPKIEELLRAIEGVLK